MEAPSTPAQAYALPGSADAVLAHAQLRVSGGQQRSPAAVRSIGEETGRSSAGSEQATDCCRCWASARKVLGIRDLVLSLLDWLAILYIPQL